MKNGQFDAICLPYHRNDHARLTRQTNYTNPPRQSKPLALNEARSILLAPYGFRDPPKRSPRSQDQRLSASTLSSAHAGLVQPRPFNAHNDEKDPLTLDFSDRNHAIAPSDHCGRGRLQWKYI